MGLQCTVMGLGWRDTVHCDGVTVHCNAVGVEACHSAALIAVRDEEDRGAEKRLHKCQEQRENTVEIA